jgi:hypothetical protein
MKHPEKKSPGASADAVVVEALARRMQSHRQIVSRAHKAQGQFPRSIFFQWVMALAVQPQG